MDGGAPTRARLNCSPPGLFQADPAQRRLEGARAVFGRYPVFESPTSAGRGGRRSSAARLLQRNSPTGKRRSTALVRFRLQAVGSLRAYVAAGRSGEIPPHTGGDLNLAYKLAIRHSVPQAAVDYPPAMGLRAVEALLDVLRGRPVPRRIDVPTEIVVTRGHATRSVRPDLWSDEHVRWDLPDDLILASGLGASYDPAHFASTTKAIATTARPRITRGRPMRADETIGVAAALACCGVCARRARRPY